MPTSSVPIALQATTVRRDAFSMRLGSDLLFGFFAGWLPSAIGSPTSVGRRWTLSDYHASACDVRAAHMNIEINPPALFEAMPGRNAVVNCPQDNVAVDQVPYGSNVPVPFSKAQPSYSNRRSGRIISFKHLTGVA